MPSLTSSLRRRAHPVTFELPDGGGLIEINPPNEAQIVRCLLLDPAPDAPPETAAQEVVRRGRQARILLGPEHHYLLELLQPLQVHEIVTALYIAASGLDAVAYARLQRELRQAGAVQSALAQIEQLDQMIIDISAELGITPAEAEKMPMADVVALSGALAAKRKAKADLQAMIAGVKLEWRE